MLQPLAVYCEAVEDQRNRPEHEQAARVAIQRLERYLRAHGQVVESAPPGPDSWQRLLGGLSSLQQQRRQRPAASPWPRIDEVLERIELQTYASISDLFPGLLAWHAEWQQEAEQFASLYPDSAPLIAQAQQALSLYREAVGALAEQAWQPAGELLRAASKRLGEVSDSWASTRVARGFSRFPVVDALGWSIRRGKPDGGPAQDLLQALNDSAEAVLREQFPQPRSVDEWDDIFGPRLEQLFGELEQPDIAVVQRLHDYVEDHGRWLERAGQPRDYSALAWWADLRRATVRWHRGAIGRSEVGQFIRTARTQLQVDLSAWPENDRVQRQQLVDATSKWLDQLETYLSQRNRSQLQQWVGWGDGRYDRWLWLAKA